MPAHQWPAAAAGMKAAVIKGWMVEPSMEMCIRDRLEQVQTVNKVDLKDYIGTVDDEQLIRRINTMLKKTFGLWIYKKRCV